VAVLAGLAISRWTRRPDDPDEPERRRRARVNKIGRIAEGRVLDIMEVPGPQPEPRGFAVLGRGKTNASPAPRRLVCYSYTISGVSFETAQDITSLAQRAGLERLEAGQLASVKYDPVNPSNSIVVADDWCGVP
jgi:hypothetical protein